MCVVFFFVFFFTSLDICLYVPIILVIGSDGGARSMMNRCKQCLQVDITGYGTPTEYISASEYREFYISWAGKTFSAKKKKKRRKEN